MDKEEIIKEEWRPINGFEGYYEVSSFGRVRSLARQAKVGSGGRRTVRSRIMKLLKRGASRTDSVKLSKGYGKPVERFVKSLVVEAFYLTRDVYKFIHLDGDIHNNSLQNLILRPPKPKKLTKIEMMLEARDLYWKKRIEEATRTSYRYDNMWNTGWNQAMQHVRNELLKEVVTFINCEQIGSMENPFNN